MIMIMNYQRTNNTCFKYEILPSFSNTRLEIDRSPFAYIINYTFSKELVGINSPVKIGSFTSPFLSFGNKFGGIQNG